jgi:DNA-binding transcriptional ArsR family regulator/predicted enzyme related to lactoylglutathione lyase
MESVFEIIAEPNRRAILSLLVSSQQSVGEIGRQLRMPQPTVSKHLRVLREAGFVESTVDAQRRLYRLKPEPLQEVDAWLAPFRRLWSAHVDALERHLDRMESVNTNEKEDKEKTTRPKPRTEERRNEMKIKVTSVYVDDQDKALRFYTEVLGFAKKADVSQGPYRWLTVASSEEPDGAELQLALNDNPAAKAYQQAMFQQGQPAAMFYTDDVKGDYERIKARGAEFTMPPTDVTASTIAMLNDTCGNLIQLTQLARS